MVHLKDVEGISKAPIIFFELRDGYDVVHVKPCRRCYERDGKIVKPEFYQFSDDVSFVDTYRIFCPECDDKIFLSGMVSDFSPDKAEKRWNDWEEPLEDWESDIDW